MDAEKTFYQDILDAVEDHKIELSASESDFIDGLEDYDLNELTRKQREWLDRIHSKISMW